MVWKVLSTGSREHTLILLWVLFLDPLYIHRDAKITIVRVGFLKSAIVKRIGRISWSVFQSLTGFWLGSLKMSVPLATLDTSMYSLSRWVDSDVDCFFDRKCNLKHLMIPFFTFATF